MKAYYHSNVLSQRLSVFYDSENPEYLMIEVEGFREKLILRAKPGSEFMATAGEDEFKLWERSEYAQYSPREVLKDVKNSITRITFLGRTFQGWKEFERFLEDPEVAEPKYRSTVEFPKSVEIAMRLKAEDEGKNIKDLVIEALRAYL